MRKGLQKCFGTSQAQETVDVVSAELLVDQFNNFLDVVFVGRFSASSLLACAGEKLEIENKVLQKVLGQPTSCTGFYQQRMQDNQFYVNEEF